MIDLSSLPINLIDKRVTVLGAKRSGLAAALLLAKNDARILLSDSGDVTIPLTVQSDLHKYNVTVETGHHSSEVLNSDFVVFSPGIPNSAPIVKDIESAGIPIVSEIEVAYWFMPEAQLIAVTGSNGKTTTTTLIYEMFKKNRFDAYCGGNIGIPFSSLISETQKDTGKQKVFILEVSSFQLERIIHFHPNAAIILNVTDDHMDRYDHDISLYLKAKLNISRNQDKNDLFIYFDDDSLLKNNLPDLPQKLPFGFTTNPQMRFKTDMTRIFTKDDQTYINRKDIALLGEHNLLNVLAALNVADYYNLPQKHIKGLLKRFSGIEHRLEYVRTFNGVDYYNDSKATNIESVKYALKSFTKPVIIILGGRDKDSDFSLLLPLLQKHAKKAIIIGEAADKIKNIIDGIINYSHANSLENAVLQAKNDAVAGNVILLAPACASFDMFDNYEHRGNVFKTIVNSLTERDSNER